MNIEITKIGQVDLEYGQSDHYYLIKEKDHNDLDLISLDEYLYEKYSYESSYPGGAFCTMIYSVHARWCKDVAITTMCHRLDI